MGYLHIDNLYKAREILEFKECYALEKIHGTSAHLSWREGKVHYFSGAEAYEKFMAYFDDAALTAKFQAAGVETCMVFGEAYGGKQQGMSTVYGKTMKFIVFDVQIGESWLSVPDMDQFAKNLGLEVVDWVRIPTTAEALDHERDRDSVQAIRNGCGVDKPREGIVLRPPYEIRKNNGARVIAKYKREDFKERIKPPPAFSQEKLAVLDNAKAIADEWVTHMRLTHVLDKIPMDQQKLENMKGIIDAMVADVYREGQSELVPSKEATQAIGARTARLFKEHLTTEMKNANQPPTA